MREIRWYYPENLKQLPDLLKREGVIPHGGGTGILRGSLNHIEGLIDLGNLQLRYVRYRNGKIEVGAGTTYADLIEHLSGTDPDHILVKALKAAASTPLRNRITVGGSAAFFPVWSDLMGPLLALDAEVTLTGEKGGSYSLSDYTKNGELRKMSLITSVQWKNKSWTSFYHRESRTKVDYPVFSISILLKVRKDTIEDIKIIIVGTARRFTQCLQIEESLKSLTLDQARIEGIGSKLDVQFTGRRNFSAEYLKHCVGIQLERGLKAILRS